MDYLNRKCEEEKKQGVDSYYQNENEQDSNPTRYHAYGQYTVIRHTCRTEGLTPRIFDYLVDNSGVVPEFDDLVKRKIKANEVRSSALENDPSLRDLDPEQRRRRLREMRRHLRETLDVEFPLYELIDSLPSETLHMLIDSMAQEYVVVQEPYIVEID